MSDSPAGPLTKREREALVCLCAEGLTWEETRVRMGIGSSTLSKRLANIYRKLGAPNMPGACFRFGLRARNLVDASRERKAA